METPAEKRAQEGVEERPTADALPDPGARPAEARDSVAYEDFARLHFRVATVTAAERVPKTDRLLRLELTLGDETRQIVAGIGTRYEPEVMVGRQIIVIANLQPAVIRGVESQGMLLAASQGDTLKLVTVDGDIGPGASVK